MAGDEWPAIRSAGAKDALAAGAKSRGSVGRGRGDDMGKDERREEQFARPPFLALMLSANAETE